jgi:transposase
MDTSLRELEVENAALKSENERLRQEIADLRARVEMLTAALEETQRAGKRQAAPFRKAEEPKPNPKKSGRKPGKRHGRHAHRAIPQHIDERYDVPLPDACPHCGGRQVSETWMATQYQTEIPRRAIHREFRIHVGQCDECGRRVHGRHELQTSDALAAAGSQLGPDAHAAFVTLNKELGLSHGKVARVFNTLFGMPIARATSARSILRSARLARNAYERLRLLVRASPWVVPDETGWRVGGRNAWLHGFVTDNATCYEVGDRSGLVAERLLGIDWSGTMIHDGWSVYDRFKSAVHQQCVAHLARRCKRLLETAVGAASWLPRAVLELLDEAFALRRAWRGHRLDGDALATEGLRLACELEEFASGRFTCQVNRRLAAHIRAHAMHWFWFLIDPSIDATNYRAEQAMRPAVVNRKVWGGNRTWCGAQAQAILMSINRTLWQRGHDALDWFSRLHRNTSPLFLPSAMR